MDFQISGYYVKASGTDGKGNFLPPFIYGVEITGVSPCEDHEWLRQAQGNKTKLKLLPAELTETQRVMDLKKDIEILRNELRVKSAAAFQREAFITDLENQLIELRKSNAKQE